MAAVIIEPVLGEGGFVAAPPEYLRRIKQICEDHGIVFIADEIQTGMGRTGKYFAIEHADIEPDLLLSAKSLGSGYPIAAVTGLAEIMDSPPPGSIGGTYGGNPVACAAALAVFDIIESENLLTRAEAIGKRIRASMQDLQAKYPVVGDVRGLGAMMAMELVVDRDTKQPAAALAKEVRNGAFERGVLSLLAGAGDNVVRVSGAAHHRRRGAGARSSRESRPRWRQRSPSTIGTTREQGDADRQWHQPRGQRRRRPVPAGLLA